MKSLSLSLLAFGFFGAALVNCSAGGANSPKDNGSTGSGGAGGLIVGGSGGSLASGGSGANGPCVAIGSIGQPGQFGDNGMDTTTAFQTWMQSKSNATLQMVTAPTPITADFLAQFQVLVIQGLMDNVKSPTSFWTITPDEVSALQTWVQAGGGLIAMSGYTGPVQEVTPVNTLLSFTGIQYNMDDILPNCVWPNTSLCYCWGSSDPFSGFIASTPIGANISKVGVFHGRSLSVSAPDATIVAQDGSTVLGATRQIGNGRVFVFADEWVTYTSQWAGSSKTQNDQTCTNGGYTGDKFFQVPQFWYNAFKWVSQSSCFDIQDNSIIK